jgi:hypothetical protein
MKTLQSSASRMLFLSCVAVFLSFTTNLMAVVVATTFGPGDSYNTLSSYSVSPTSQLAAFFVPSVTVLLSNVELAGAAGAGTNMSVKITSDAGGVPGAVLQQSTIEFPTAIGTASFPGTLTLNAGTTYWLWYGSGTSATGLWYRNDQGLTGYAFTTNAGSTWGTFSAAPSPAYRVNGVPEPSRSLLLGLCAFALGWRRRRPAGAAS